MAALAPLSPAKQTTTTGEHRRGDLLMLFMLLTFNSGLVMYTSWGDLVAVTSAVGTNVAVGLLLGRLFGVWVTRQLDPIIWLLFLLLGVLQVSRLARTPAASLTSAPMLLGVAATAVLAVGGVCSYLLHRRRCLKQPR